MGRWGKLEGHRSFDEATIQRLLDVLEQRRVGIDVRRICALMLSAQDDDYGQTSIFENEAGETQE
jgi:hypothetical protein